MSVQRPRADAAALCSTCLIFSVVKSNSSWAERAIRSATHIRCAQQWKFRPSSSKNVAHRAKSSASADLDQCLSRVRGWQERCTLSPRKLLFSFHGKGARQRGGGGIFWQKDRHADEIGYIRINEHVTVLTRRFSVQFSSLTCPPASSAPFPRPTCGGATPGTTWGCA